MYTRTTILEPAQSLCASFANHSSTATLISHFTSNPLPSIHEHGHPSLTPFLGRTFTGQDGIGRYFSLLSDLLDIQDIQFDSDDIWIVDPVSMAVSVRGSARFTWKSTNESWDETFCYRIAVAEDLADLGDERGGGRKRLKVQDYSVWSDTGAAWLARNGQLGEMQEKRETEGMEGSRSRERRRSGCGEVVGGGLGAFGSCR